MEIKYKLLDTVYMYEGQSIIETTIKAVNIKEKGTTYVVEGKYHAKQESELFATVNDLVKDLTSRILKPRSLSEKAKSLFKK